MVNIIPVDGPEPLHLWRFESASWQDEADPGIGAPDSLRDPDRAEEVAPHHLPEPPDHP
jgi:hypothetical protein